MQRKDKIETKMVKTSHGHERAMAVAKKAWDEAFELRFELGKSQQAIEAADEEAGKPQDPPERGGHAINRRSRESDRPN